jgi:hypothetical protein
MMTLRRLAVLAGVAVAALAAVPPAVADPPSDADESDAYPIAQGNFTTTTDFYAIFFKTPDGRSCGIWPNGGPIGCDAVPADAPAGTNQTFVFPGVVADYRHSDTPSFTRDVDVLPEGFRLETWGAGCGVGPQETVTCKTYGQHRFVISRDHGVLW